MTKKPKLKKKWKSSKTCEFWRFQAKRIARLNSAISFTYCSTSQNLFSTFVRKCHLFDMNIIKNCIKLMLWRLGTMLKRFFKAKSFSLHIQKPKVPQSTQNHLNRNQTSTDNWLTCVIFVCIIAVYHCYVL